MEGHRLDEYIFQAQRLASRSAICLTAVLRRMGRRMLLSTASDRRFAIGAPVHDLRELCELALAHATQSAVEAAYLTSTMTERRRPMMRDWAAWCAGADAARCGGRAQAAQRQVKAQQAAPTITMRALHDHDFEQLRSRLQDAAIEYGPAKPAPGSTAYRAWVKRRDLQGMLKTFESDPTSPAVRAAAASSHPGRVAAAVDALPGTGATSERNTHARWLRVSVAETEQPCRKPSAKVRRNRQRETKIWQDVVTIHAERMRHDQPSAERIS